MKVSSKRMFASFAIATLAFSLGTDLAYARGGGGGGGGGGGRGGFSSPSISRSSPSSSSGFFKSSPAPAPAPSPSRVTVAPAPVSVPSPSKAVVPPAPPPKTPSVAVSPAPSQAPAFRTGDGSKSLSAPVERRTFDASGAQALKDQTSREKYLAAQPKPDTSSPPKEQTAAQSKPSANDPVYTYKRDEHVADLRRQLSRERWLNRQAREEQYYSRYAGRPPIFAQQSYNDAFGNPFFWMWLMDQGKHTSDQWIYKHQSEIDPTRMAELRQRDQDLDNRLRALESGGVQKDTKFAPPEMKGNEDLMYGKDVVYAAAKAQHSHSNLWLYLGALLLLGACAYYFIFVFRGWGKSRLQHGE